MILTFPYREILESGTNFPDEIELRDHLGGFDQNYSNAVLETLNDISKKRQIPITVLYHQFLPDGVTNLYPDLKIKFNIEHQIDGNLRWFEGYNIHPKLTFKNFLCSFNGSSHVSRKLLVSILHRFGWFDRTTCSKNFSYTIDVLEGHLQDFLDEDQCRVYNKFFIGNDSQVFFRKEFSFGYIQFDHKNNIYNLEGKITQSFLHIVSETLATSYYPFVTEKFLYSIVTRGLFLAYAQPGWHDHLERYYGFQKYNKIFDYRFDEIQNPVKRLVELMSIISKFSVLSPIEWHDLYEMEKHTIEHNYDHYFSKDYLKFLKKYQEN